jgi:hypothetical protein
VQGGVTLTQGRTGEAAELAQRDHHQALNVRRQAPDSTSADPAPFTQCPQHHEPALNMAADTTHRPRRSHETAGTREGSTMTIHDRLIGSWALTEGDTAVSRRSFHRK